MSRQLTMVEWYAQRDETPAGHYLYIYRFQCPTCNWCWESSSDQWDMDQWDMDQWDMDQWDKDQWDKGADYHQERCNSDECCGCGPLIDPLDYAGGRVGRDWRGFSDAADIEWADKMAIQGEWYEVSWDMYSDWIDQLRI